MLIKNLFNAHIAEQREKREIKVTINTRTFSEPWTIVTIQTLTTKRAEESIAQRMESRLWNKSGGSR